MHHVKPLKRPRHRIALMELERIPWLRLDVNADHLEARPMIAHRSAPRATEQVQQSWLIGHDRDYAPTDREQSTPAARFPPRWPRKETAVPPPLAEQPP